MLYLINCLTLQYRPLTWRNTHPYVLVDRVEDITYPNNVEIDEDQNKEIAFYGYIRGTNFSDNQKIHIPGVGDFTCENVKSLVDPLPIVDDDGVSSFLMYYVGLIFLLFSFLHFKSF